MIRLPEEQILSLESTEPRNTNDDLLNLVSAVGKTDE
jgi:hypothetical protein